jgi:hypothetical protein
MDVIPMRVAKPIHLSRHGNTGYEFDPKATEVVILDRSGRTIWQKRKGETPAPIRWTGIDTLGQTVETGDYICKIVYPQDKIAYMPFVFVKKG